MKKIILLTIFFFIQGCSFDDKSGIWNNDNIVIKKKDKTFKDFETLVTSEKIFDKIIPIQNDYNFTSGPTKKNSKWHDELYNSSNNFDNFSYNEINELIFKSRKITRYLPNRSFLFTKNNIILSDEKGNITDEANPNGAIENIAGVCNAGRNVFGMMPHPERAAETILGCDDGKSIFESISGFGWA